LSGSPEWQAFTCSSPKAGKQPLQIAVLSATAQRPQDVAVKGARFRDGKHGRFSGKAVLPEAHWRAENDKTGTLCGTGMETKLLEDELCFAVYGASLALNKKKILSTGLVG